MKIYTEDFVIEIKARFTDEKRNSLKALKTVLSSWRLGEFEAYLAFKKENQHRMANYHYNTYLAIKEVIKDLDK